MFLADGEIRQSRLRKDALLPNSQTPRPAWTIPIGVAAIVAVEVTVDRPCHETACPAPLLHCAGKGAELANKSHIESAGQSIRLRFDTSEVL